VRPGQVVLGAAALLVVCRAVPGLRAQTPGTPRVAGYVQPRLQVTGDSAVFVLNRARVGIEGDPAPWASYKVQVEARSLAVNGAPAAVTATDLYVAAHRPAWRIVAGQFKVPFSLEELAPLSTLELPERSLVVTAQAPKRDIGLMGEWRPVGAVQLEAGAFNGEGPNRAGNPDKKLSYVARLLATPAPGLDVGAAAAAYPDSTWWDLQAGYRRGSWRARGEVLRRDRVRPADHASGWYAQAAYLVPRVRLQLVGRVEQYAPSAAAGGRETGYTAGAQYLFRGDDLKLQTSYTAYGGSGAAVTHNPFILQLQARF
jgi:phosphate-selective porin